MVYYKFTLINIDVWHDGTGWYWNDQFVLERDIFFEESQITPRKVLKFLRKAGYLTNNSIGKLTVVIDWDYCIEIRSKNTCKPLLALLFENKLEE